ncbi:MAG TPA: LytTR family DNA-binding domain-containing protein [Opitutaceae bacterium]|nr:LytTR family DNA-binding domain-containing protein [Opitutaceae bacterium]
MKLRALIVDDEPLARERLRGFLSGEPDVAVVGECGDGPAAAAAIRRETPDVVFLDLQMPGCGGLEVVAQLPAARRPAVVFATAHERFAVDAFDLEAVDYLLKPFDRERLRQALRRVRAHLGRRAGVDEAGGDGAAGDRVAVKADGRIVFLAPAEVLRVEAADNYVILHLAGGRLMVRETMAAIESRLGPRLFARINRSALVQLAQIREIQPAQHGDYSVVLRDGTRLPLSRSLRGQLDRFLPDHA